MTSTTFRRPALAYLFIPRNELFKLSNLANTAGSVRDAARRRPPGSGANKLASLIKISDGSIVPGRSIRHQPFTPASASASRPSRNRTTSCLFPFIVSADCGARTSGVVHVNGQITSARLADDISKKSARLARPDNPANFAPARTVHVNSRAGYRGRVSRARPFADPI